MINDKPQGSGATHLKCGAVTGFLYTSLFHRLGRKKLEICKQTTRNRKETEKQYLSNSKQVNENLYFTRINNSAAKQAEKNNNLINLTINRTESIHTA